MIRKALDWAPLPIRLVAGAGLMYHGAPKLFSRLGHENIVSMLEAQGVPNPELTGWVVGATEFFGGMALLGGAGVRLVGGAIAGMIGINLASAARRGGFPEPLPGGQPLPGVEDSFFYALCALSLTISGAGMFALDRLRERPAAPRSRVPWRS